MKYRIHICVLAVIFYITGNITYADEFTDMLQDLAVQTACLGTYSSTEAGKTSKEDPHDYYTPSMMAERFSEMSGSRTRIETFYGICFDYANCAYDYLERNKDFYKNIGILGEQFWIAVCAYDSNSLELSNPVSAEEGSRIWNGVPVKTYGNASYINVKTHGNNTTYHAWLWVQRYDGVWFWIDPTWTDNSGFVIYGYVGDGQEIQCRPNKELCINYPSELKYLPDPPKAGKIPNTDSYRDPVLANEKVVINKDECYYWKFTVPEDSKYIEVTCNSDAKLHNSMSFAIVSSIEDADKFYKHCKGRDEKFNYIEGTYKVNVKSYSIVLEGLNPKETYYFCVYKDSKLFARKQYEIEVTVRTW